MVKPLHAGLAARNGVLAALLARGGHDGERAGDRRAAGLSARRWTASSRRSAARSPISARAGRSLDTGITVKLYPSCAGTHPTLDALLDLRRREGFGADEVERDRRRRRLDRADDPDLRPAGERTRRQVQHAVLRRGRGRPRPRRHRHVRRGDARRSGDPALMPRVTMRVDPTLDASAPPLTQARVTRPPARRPRADRRTPTARAAIRSGRRATTSWRPSSWPARRRRCPRLRPSARSRCCDDRRARRRSNADRRARCRQSRPDCRVR